MSGVPRKIEMTSWQNSESGLNRESLPSATIMPKGSDPTSVTAKICRDVT